MSISANLQRLRAELPPQVTLVAVSKTKPVSLLMEAYTSGVRDFGENYVQEWLEKQPLLPADVRWHFIGHLQTNKAKYIVPHIYCIHGIDSLRLLKEVEKQASRCQRKVKCLLQIHVAQEETKHGWNPQELLDEASNLSLAAYPHIVFAGVMAMASFTEDETIVRSEFKQAKAVFETLRSSVFAGYDAFREISMGMSGDYRIAIEEGATLVRIGSAVFGARG
jgi:PLP dependent protein